ncbi:fungal-specific transcription factor domain-containing protein [Aspergillus caelatus]|uniref:Fungal-specific transcription factor domain-containing protein n=1 Tax=Aspergillus caelatus TaxID=61420 RepID=A0A5N7AA24_9EURO|nr:fungal-specific transcription factor domain-containing protein [Aspergillus caelatus]KAE8366727.1 fungal-specific transcription factor domain-containing protein [Aspergillus caelatus]
MNTAAANCADFPCWTCRRRRLKCDRALPICGKCTSSQRPCLGYSKDKPLRWTNSVASRGKLMGKQVPRQEQYLPISRVLNDPGLQDLSPSMRDYIAYFEQQCCQECVLYDFERVNPFKEFMRLIPSCPGLCHAVVSVAALHQAFRIASAQCNEKIMAYKSNPSEVQISQWVEEMHQLHQLPTYHDALYHKQQTLSFLRSEAHAGYFSNPDGVIASMIMSIWLELMDSGRDTWRYHLRGLREVMPKRGLSLAPFRDGELTADLPQMIEYFGTSYTIFEIIGSTFVKAKQPYQPLFSMSTTLDILKRSESQTWTGCPATLLYVLSLVNAAASSSYELPPDLIDNIFSHLWSFSPMKWAVAVAETHYMKPRYQLACVWQAAVDIYALQVLPVPFESDVINGGRISNSLDAILHHLKSMDPADVHLKGILWPAFVIGAEAQTMSQRVLITDVFGHLWTLWRCHNVTNALKVLEKIWARRAMEGSSRRWIEYVYEWGEDWMFV